MRLIDDATSGGVPVLRIEGEVDLETAAELRTRLTSILSAGSPVVVVDLSAVSFFDSTGLKVLEDVQRDARERAVSLAVACPDERLLRLFRITGLLDRFAIEDTAERAAASAGR